MHEVIPMHDDKPVTASVRLELEGDLLASVESWRGTQEPKIPSRTQALRLLITQGLQAAEASAPAAA
jgi:hypothetical protein